MRKKHTLIWTGWILVLVLPVLSIVVIAAPYREHMGIWQASAAYYLQNAKVKIILYPVGKGTEHSPSTSTMASFTQFFRLCKYIVFSSCPFFRSKMYRFLSSIAPINTKERLGEYYSFITTCIYLLSVYYVPDRVPGTMIHCWTRQIKFLPF